MGLSQLKSSEDVDVAAVLRERDIEITELRIQLDDKDRMLTALRSAARQRDIAQMPMEAAGSEKQASQHNSEGNASLLASPSAPDPTSPAHPTSPVKALEKDKEKEKEKEGKRKSADEMSRMLDEMIQDRVENGHLTKSARGSIRVLSGTATRRESIGPIPALSGALGPRNSAIAETPEADA